MGHERVRGGETLVFSDAAEAQAFRESVEQRVDSSPVPRIGRKREIVGEELAKKFDEHGVGVSSLHVPWEHTHAEHEEVQQLVTVAFTHGLSDAIRQAERSETFPRNIDLLHDVLTGQLYEAVLERHINRIHASPITVIVALVPILFLLLALLFFVYSL